MLEHLLPAPALCTQEDQSSVGTEGAARWRADDDQVGLIAEARAGVNQADQTEVKVGGD